MQKNPSFNVVATLFALVLLLSGCAGQVRHMEEVAATGSPVLPEPGKALVVFVRPSGFGFAIQSSVFAINDNSSSLIGILAAKTKIAYQAEPGKHLFMVIGENADFMSATLEANKTYYAQVAPRMGLWKARFALEPVPKKELDTPELKSSLEDCRWVQKTAASENWASGNMASIQSKRTEYFKDWAAKLEFERPQLLAEDGT
jgi:hypothetical protein